MRNLTLALLLIWSQLLLPNAYAAQSEGLTISVTVGHTLSVKIDTTNIQMGTVNPGAEATSASAVTVTNDGSGVGQTYLLSLTNPADWTAATTAGQDQYVLMAAFSANTSGVSWNAVNHALSTAPTSCSATKFAGDQTGVDVAYNAVRKLWFKFSAPTVTQASNAQNIGVTISAELAP